jgi:hypothetical protein
LNPRTTGVRGCAAFMARTHSMSMARRKSAFPGSDLRDDLVEFAHS